MSATYTPPSVGENDLRPPTPAEAEIHRAMSRLMRPLEATAASLMVLIIALLLVAVLSRYVFSQSIVWVDEVVSLAFIWLTMIGTAIAMHRNEHLRLTLVVELLPARMRDFVNALALAAIAVFLIALMPPAYEYAKEEWAITTPALNIPNTFRVASIGFGLAAMLLVVLAYAWKTVKPRNLVAAAAIVAGIGALCYWQMPALASLGNVNIAIFLVGLVALCLAAGVPIAFCFGLGALTFLTFTTQVPLLIVVGRMDEGMSSIIPSRCRSSCCWAACSTRRAWARPSSTSWPRCWAT